MRLIDLEKKKCLTLGVVYVSLDESIVTLYTEPTQ